MPANIFLEICYYGVAFFYLLAGILTLLSPQLVTPHLTRFFPVLAALRYSHLGNSLNLIVVGSTLIIVAKLITNMNPLGFFIALIFSALEVYLGVKFYYYEQKDVFQSLIHVIIHVVIAGLIFWFILTYFSEDVSRAQYNVANVINVF